MEISAVERQLQVTFPEVYRRILRAAGSSFPGTSPLFPLHRLVAQQADWWQTAKEDDFHIPHAAQVVFFDETEQYEAYYFQADGSDDPEVFAYNYYDGGDTPIRQGRLSDFLAMRIRESLAL